MTRRRSGFGGVNKLRRTLRRLDPEILKGVQDVVTKGAERIAADARSIVPVDSGDLQSAIGVRLGRDRLTADIGISPGGGKKRAAARSDLFYARFVELGTKGGPNYPARPARPFMGPAFDQNEKQITADLREAITKAVKATSGGNR